RRETTGRPPVRPWPAPGQRARPPRKTCLVVQGTRCDAMRRREQSFCGQDRTTMDESALRFLLDELSSGRIHPDEAIRSLRRLPFADLGYAKVDHHRSLRQGLPEAVYGPGKTPEQCVGIVGELLAEPSGGPVVLSRANPEQAMRVSDAHPGAIGTGSTLVWRPAAPRPERITVVTAGTADLPVAEECEATLWAFGYKPGLIPDCGVA